MTTEDSPLFEKKKTNWIMRILKLSFVLAALFLIGITILANMGGSSDSLKESVERFSSELSGGRKATVEKLVDMSFFPKVGIAIENLHILSNAEGGFPIVKVGKLQVYMPFWHVAVRDPRFSRFYIEDVELIKGILGAQEFVIDTAYVDHDRETGAAKLIANGNIGPHEWKVSAGLQVDGGNGQYTYRLQKGFPLNIQLADINIQATVVNHEADYFKINDLKVFMGDIAFGGDIVLSALDKNTLKVKGQIAARPDEKEANLSLDWIIDRTQKNKSLKGTVIGQNVKFNDYMGDDSVLTVIRRIREVMGYDLIQQNTDFRLLGPSDLDLSFDLKNVSFDDGNIRSLGFSLVQESGRVKASSIQNEGKQLSPSIIFVEDTEQNEWKLLVHDGDISAAFMSLFLPGLKDIDDVRVDCGWGAIVKDDSGVRLEQFIAKTDQGMLTGKYVNGDTQFTLKDNGADIEAIMLNPSALHFVNSSLAAVASGSACNGIVKEISQ